MVTISKLYFQIKWSPTDESPMLYLFLLVCPGSWEIQQVIGLTVNVKKNRTIIGNPYGKKKSSVS